MILEYKDIPIFYDDIGKGPAVILLHGFLENTSMWQEIIPKLSKSNRIITIDLLGHGQTGCLGYMHSMEEMALAVHAVLELLRLRRVTLIGHSMGGYVALAFAELFPKKMKGICLVNSTAKEDTKGRKALRTRANKMAQTNYRNMIAMSISNLFQPKNLSLFSKDVEHVKNEALKTPLQGYLAAQEGMKIRINRENVMSKIDRKLYIIGKYDPILNAESVLKEANDAASQSVTFNGGHMSHIENKNQLIKELKTFIRLAR